MSTYNPNAYVVVYRLVLGTFVHVNDENETLKIDLFINTLYLFVLMQRCGRRESASS